MPSNRDEIKKLAGKYNVYPPVEIVVCEECGRAHPVDGQEFMTIQGNICFGLGGGLIGNNIDEYGKVFHMTVVCKNGCALQLLQKTLLTHLKADDGSNLRDAWCRSSR